MPKGTKGFVRGNQFGRTSYRNRRSYVGENNPNYGKTHTEAARDAIRQSKLGDKSPTWKGDRVGKGAVHEWVKKRLPKPTACPACGTTERRIELSNTGHTYRRRVEDYEWLCSRCHFRKDGRERYLKQHVEEHPIVRERIQWEKD